MTNNIFVPQTFNGERMVNVNVVNRKNGPSPNNTTITTPSEAKKIVIAPNEPVIIESEHGNKNNTKNKTIAPAPIVNQTYLTTNATPSSSTPTPTMDERTSQKYWSEANIAMLIQLHRKYYSNNNEINWTQLVQEYNNITGEDRGLKAITNKWTTLLKKYNAERCCMLQQPNNSNNKTPIPTVSYWNHFQYMDSYLSHTPILEDSLEYDNDFDDVVIPTTKRIEDQQRSRKESNESINYIVMEQALKHQQTQLDLLQKNYENMNQMNMKFVEICEKITLKNQSNESRYLDLLEKYMNDKLSSQNIPRKRKVENDVDGLEED